MKDNTLGWIVLVVSTLVLVYFGVTLWQELVFLAKGMGFGMSPPVFSVLFFALGLVGIWFGMDRIENPKKALVVSLVLFVSLMAAHVVYANANMRSSDNGSEASFYVADSSGNLIEAVPKTAFGLFSFWAGDTNLGTTFAIKFDCRIKVKDSINQPSGLGFDKRLYVIHPGSGAYVTSAGGLTSNSIVNRQGSVDPATAGTYASGWDEVSSETWVNSYGRGGKSKLTLFTIGYNDPMWVGQSLATQPGDEGGSASRDKLYFYGDVKANAMAGSVSVSTGYLASPKIVIERKETTASMVFDDISWSP